MAKVFIGVDPHKLSTTIRVVDERGRGVLATAAAGPAGRPGSCDPRARHQISTRPLWADRGRYDRASHPLARRATGRRRARHEHTQRSCRARRRELDTGHNRKTDAHDAHAVAVVAVRTADASGPVLRRAARGARLLADRRET